MGTSSPEFSPGDLVQRVNQPESVGVVREARWDEQAESWNYLVQFGAQLKALPQEALQKVRLVATPWDALKERSFSGITHFVFTLTYHRLRRPPTRIANSFATARTEFYPHQFKPLLKFLDHPAKRLLIADDVGLGKTIEAGYILRELEAQQVVEKVLILVPARLLSKWKRELQTRFEETFEVVRGSDLRGLADRLRKGQEPEPYRWIVSYESARQEDVRQALEETQPPIDVLIADEAHRMRNPESLQHKVGSVLCRCADTAVLLSATPVQNRLEDLWHLLRLLSPEEFADWMLFQDQIEANRFLLACQRAVAQRPPRLEEAGQTLANFFVSRAGKHLAETDFSRSVQERVARSDLQRHEVVELQADLARLSPIGHALTRTRKAEAIPDRSRRTAVWVRVPLASEERRFYDSVEKLCSLSWPGSVDSWGYRMSLITAYRITASCIPAAIDYFASRLGVNRSAIADLIEEESRDEISTGTGSHLASWPPEARDRLAEIVSHFKLPLVRDSKFEELVSAISKIWQEDDKARRTRRKLVVFSYFPRTLEYLAGVFRERSINARVIHGGIDVDDREIAIDDFLQRPDVHVLLTSDVGGEGIDLQRASVLINYDLPWNPMVVEQRIGRIDRIGQEAKVLNVINLVVQDSIEERVLAKLLDKIQIFRESIGELDPIIGEEIERLTTQAVSGELSDAELLQVVNEKGDALARRLLEARQMLSRVDSLLAADQGLIDEINAITGERQLPTASELLQFLNGFLATKVAGCQIPRKAIADVTSVDFGAELAADLERESAELGPEVGRFVRRITSGPIQLTLSREVGYRHPRIELIHLRHPLVRYAVRQVSSAGHSSNAAFSLKLERSDKLNSGTYCFLISLLEIKGARSSIRLVAAFAAVGSQQVWIDPDYTIPVVLEILDQGEAADPPSLNDIEVEAAKNTLLGAVNRLVADISAREQRLDYIRTEQQRAAVKATLEIRIQRAKQRLLTLEERGASEFPLRMARANLDKAMREFEGFTASLFKPAWEGVVREEIAVGFVRVEH